MTTSAALSVAPTSSTARKTKAISLSKSTSRDSASSVIVVAFLVRSWVWSDPWAGCERRSADRLRASGDPPGPAAYTASVLVGRESECTALDGLLAGARVGTSGVLVVAGEPGIGKTALLEQAATLARDMRVLRAQGTESEQLVPFAGLLQLLRPLLRLLPDIPGAQGKALASALLLGPAGEAQPSRFAVGAATLSLLSRAAEDQPIAAFVDDAHLLDSPSLDALVFAARGLVTDRVAIVVGLRADGSAAPAGSAGSASGPASGP